MAGGRCSGLMNPKSRSVRVRALLREERGVALVVALLVMAGLVLSGITVIQLATSGGHEAAYSDARVRAFNLAEEGMNLARSTLYNAPPASYLDPGIVPVRTIPEGNGTITYSGNLNGTTWTLTGVGTTPNPTGGAPVRRTVQAKVAVTTAQVESPGNEIWGYLFHDNPNSCLSLANNVAIAANVYSRGSLCLANSAQITDGTIQVLGQITISSPQASVGASTAPIQQAAVAGGCKYRSQPLHSPCSAADHVYAQSYTTTPQSLTKPSVDLPYWYQNAGLGPKRYCTQGSFPGGPASFDNNTTLDGSVPQVDLTPATGYDCRVIDGNGNVVAQLTWVPGQGNALGSLTVKGVIYIDGYVVTTANHRAQYHGQATIYATQRITLQNHSALCGSPNCDGAWNPNVDRLILVAGSNQSQAVDIANNTDFQGGIYAVGDYYEENNTNVWGPAIADEVVIQNHSHHQAAFAGLIPGQPGFFTTTLVLQDLADRWIG